MRADTIDAIGIDDRGSLWVKPANSIFPNIYREAMEVQWDPNRRCLYGPPPRKWSYADWFRQIAAAASEQGVQLSIAPTTTWSGVAPDIRDAITREAR